MGTSHAVSSEAQTTNAFGEIHVHAPGLTIAVGRLACSESKVLKVLLLFLGNEVNHTVFTIFNTRTNTNIALFSGDYNMHPQLDLIN